MTYDPAQQKRDAAQRQADRATRAARRAEGKKTPDVAVARAQELSAKQAPPVPAKSASADHFAPTTPPRSGAKK